MNKFFQNNKFITGLAAGTAVGLVLYKALSHFSSKRLSSKESNSKDEKKGDLHDAFQNIDFTSEDYQKIKNEQLIRNIQFFGEKNQETICKAFVIVVGMGGVGSHIFTSLVRSGVGKIRIIDFDRVTLSSLNRHAFATREEVGKSKVACAVEFAKKIFPHIEVEYEEIFLSKQNLEKLLQGNPDWVIDCIDNIDAKVDLVTYCVQNKIKIISAGGAGMKADPTMIQIRDISETKYDDLSRALRVRLKKNKVFTGVPIAYSMERTERELLPLKEHQEEDPDNFRVVENYRVRIVPVVGTMPALMGYAISSYVLCNLAGQPYKPHTIEDVKFNNYIWLNQTLINNEKKRGVQDDEINFDIEDVVFLTRDVFNWTCLATQQKKSNVQLVRWNPEIPASITNMVLLNPKDAKAHMEFKTYDEVKSAYPTEVFTRYDEKQAVIAKHLKNRDPVLFG